MNTILGPQSMVHSKLPVPHRCRWHFPVSGRCWLTSSKCTNKCKGELRLWTTLLWLRNKKCVPKSTTGCISISKSQCHIAFTCTNFRIISIWLFNCRLNLWIFQHTLQFPDPSQQKIDTPPSNDLGWRCFKFFCLNRDPPRYASWLLSQRSEKKTVSKKNWTLSVENQKICWTSPPIGRTTFWNGVPPGLC